MNYFNLYKFSALEKDWWLKFDHHMHKTWPHVFEDDIVLTSSLMFSDTTKLYPHHTGRTILNFSFYCKKKTKLHLKYEYGVIVTLEFKKTQDILEYLNMSSDGIQREPQGYYVRKPADLTLATCSVSKALREDNYTFNRPFARKTFSPQDATPYNLLDWCKQTILSDFDKDDNSDDEQPDEPSPYLDSPRNLQKVK